MSPPFILKQVGNQFIKTERTPQRVCIYTQANDGNYASCTSQGWQTTETFTSMFSFWTLLHHSHPQINKEASSASLCVACIINTQHGTSTSFSSHVRECSAGAGEPCNVNSLFLIQFSVSRIPQHPSKQHQGGNTYCKQQLLNTRKALFSTVIFLYCFQEPVFQQKESMNSNHPLIIFLLLLTTFKPFCS